MSRETVTGMPPRRGAALLAARCSAVADAATFATIATFATFAAATALLVALAASSPSSAEPAPSPQALVTAPGVKPPVDPRNEALLAWADAIFPWGIGETTLDDVPGPRLRGWRLVRVSKKYAVEQRMNDTTFIATDDSGKVAIVGDAIVDEARLKVPMPIRTDADLLPLKEQLKRYLRGTFKVVFDPATDRLPTLRGVKVLADTGYGSYEIGGLVSAEDGAVLILGRAWDRKRSISEQRKELIKLANTPYAGPPDATVTVVEYSDMQCPFCKKRTGDWEPLLEKLGASLKIRRYFKAFPLVNDHPWAMRASSAGLCFFQRDPSLFLRWKASVYGRQEQLTVGDLDMFAVDFATANDYGDEAFRSCYLQPKTMQQILSNLTEGFAIRVRSTPSYFVDGVLVSWFTDGLMEDFLRATYLGGKGKKK